MKTIHDIKCADDMVGIAVEFDPETITEDEKKQIDRLFERTGRDSFQSYDGTSRFIVHDDMKSLLYNQDKDNAKTVIQLKDFLGRPKKEKTKKWILNMDGVCLKFETEKDACEHADENLEHDCSCCVSRVTTVMTRESKIKTKKYKG